MLESYADIRRSIPVEPLWWDANGVPRYWPFTPALACEVYADEVALVQIACQDCGTRFYVAFNTAGRKMDLVLGRPHRTLADRIRDGSLHYGDPPNDGCCAAGPTMNCEDLEVLEYWSRSGGQFRMDWVRDSSLEIKLDGPASGVAPQEGTHG